MTQKIFSWFLVAVTVVFAYGAGLQTQEAQTAQTQMVEMVQMEAAVYRTQVRHMKRVVRFSNRHHISYHMAQMILETAQQYEIPPNIAFRLVETESLFNPKAVSYRDAIGLTQVLPSTARHLDPSVSRSDLFDPRLNLQLGFEYLNRLRERFGSWRTALISYHRGPTRTQRELRRGTGHGSSEPYAHNILEE